MKKLKEELKYSKKGITLISLVVTIIVLLILAGITINMLFGENGLLNRATDATEKYSKAEAKEKVELLLSEYVIDKATGENEDLANFLRKNLQVGVAENEDNTYSFILGEWQVLTDENKVIRIEKFKLDVDKTYPNVANMKADTELTDGQLVQTESYWDKQYGGSAYYDIVSSTSLAVDDGKYIQLDNGLYAELHPINNTVNVNQFGAYGDGEHDDANSIQLSLNAGYRNVTFESERYKYDTIIKINTSNLAIIGNDTTLFLSEQIEYSSYAQIYIAGTETNHIQNIMVTNLKFENGNIKIKDDGSSCQVVGDYCDNINISDCTFNIYEISENSSRKLTNLWFRTEWENITIQNCEFINLTNSNVGGSIFLSDQTTNDNYISKNAIIKNNYIEKSCHDESIGIWDGNIDNIIIDSNTFKLDDGKVENPSYMNFTFGQTGGKVSNIKFINNKVSSKYAGIFTYIAGDNGSNNIFIQNNKLEYEQESLNYNNAFIQNNSKTENVIISSNNINIAKTTNSSFISGKITLENNKIDITSNYLKTFTDNDNAIEYGVPQIINNQITINSDLEYKLTGGSTRITGNTINLNGKSPNTLFGYGEYVMSDNIDISNNMITLSDSNLWGENSKTFVQFALTQINNVNVSITNNTIKVENQQNIQRLVYLNNLQDSYQQKIVFDNNNFDNFKFLQLGNNVLKHIVIVNGKEITTNTTLE